MLEEHKNAYDRDPEGWEERRRWTLTRFDEDAFSKPVEAAKLLRDEMASEDEEEVVLSLVLEATLGGRQDRMVDFVMNRPPNNDQV